jgi:hypothetical protein
MSDAQRNLSSIIPLDTTTDISQGTAFFSNNVPSAKVLIGGVLCGLLDR